MKKKKKASLIFNLLEQQDKSAFKRAIDNHMLGAIIPKDKELVYNLRRRRCHLPQIKTERYKKTFVNRLIFKNSSSRILVAGERCNILMGEYFERGSTSE